MTQRLTAAQIAEVADVTAPPARQTINRTFGLPTGLYGATVGLYLTYLAVMAIGFGNPELAIPMAIFVTFILMAFGLAAKWVTMKPDNATRTPTWGHFRLHGIETHTGRLGAGEATVQVLLLPVLILLWGVAVTVIWALT